MNETLKRAIAALRDRKFILVCDAKDREDEADLIMAAQFVDSSHVNFMINQGRGLICVPLTKEKARQLNLDLMVKKNEGTMEVAFTVSVDAKVGTHTGISSKDRATTIALLADESSKESDFVTPGHMFPLIAHPGGLLTRKGHTEAAVELMKMAGLRHVAVLCETLDNEGEPLKGEALMSFGRKWNIPVISIEEIIDSLLIK